MHIIVGGDHLILSASEVLYFKADSKYVFAYMPGRSLKFECSLDHIEREFPGGFWRVHRKYLVNRKSIVGLVMIDGSLYADIPGVAEAIPISRREAPKIRALFRAKDDMGTERNNRGQTTVSVSGTTAKVKRGQLRIDFKSG